MIPTLREPLRPLARILKARDQGENPKEIERENIRQRHEAMRDKSRSRAEGRLLILGILFFLAFGTVGVRMSVLANTEVAEPIAVAQGSPIVGQRGDIVDRNGRILATNFDTHALYAETRNMIDPLAAAAGLVEIFPQMDYRELVEDFTGPQHFLWVRRQISPEQMQAVHDIGEPGLLFGPREMRLYPNGAIAAHILGGARFGRQAVNSAEIVGVAGIELFLDDRLRDPLQSDNPVALSLDLTVQSTMEEVLHNGMTRMNARGAAGVLMDIHTGEIIAMASLPDFDPNDPPNAPQSGDPADSPLFNRALQGVYELGSVFKIFTVAQALEMHLVQPHTIIDIEGPLQWGRFEIEDFSDHGDLLSVADVITYSSNVGTARIAQMIGAEAQEGFLGQLGLLTIPPVEMVEASTSRPILPQNWSEISTMTISYGHGLSVSPLHLAAGYASVLNGGLRVEPTILRQTDPAPGPRVVRETVSMQARAMLRAVVQRGTASLGDVEGYAVGGKTGTADKPGVGGYTEDSVVATFAGLFPAHDPQYVFVVTLDEPNEVSSGAARRTAGWTAVPVASELIRRAAPLLGLRPTDDVAILADVARTSSASGGTP